ncbi:MAG TPA: mechanosensitive ion channel domain-containing protein [Cyclobacteriaceae bacterium]|nr:mechanosensitive ion channel domain-containing protein [Cyclobacteriaceae bacterium]
MMEVLDVQQAEVAEGLGRWIYKLLVGWGVDEKLASYVNLAVLLFLVVVLVYLLQYVARAVLRKAFTKIASTTKLSFFGYLLQNRFPHFLALIAPLSLIKNAIPIIFADFPAFIRPMDNLAEIYMVFMIVWILMSIVRSGVDVLKEKQPFRDKPMESYLQVVQIIFFLFGAVYLFSVLTGKSPAVFFGAMGAASAVLLLMFKDTIMGFVASIQVTTNDMVRIGDWITIPKYGADGDVLEINLTTVKVQNWDKTITTIPTYTLISDSFQNWRGMQNSGGRRIKRSLLIKQNKIRFIADEEIQRFKRIQGISTYIDERQAEIQAHNLKIGADRSVPVNGRNITNFGLFRVYVDWYLKSHPGTHKGMTMMVRQLAPTEHGMPLELYAFTNTVQWVQYEAIMADIFDHLIAAVVHFDLEIFELPTGTDVKEVNFQNPLAISSSEN